MENDADYGFTGVALKECPQHATIKDGITGAGHTEQACTLRKAGDCRFSTSDFCFDGAEFMCP
jgi:hypothetical protein